MSSVVLDASALLALLNAEPGADTVAAALPEAVIGAVNYAEVVSKLAEAGLSEAELRETLDGLALDVRPFDRAQAHAAGLLRPATRARGLSLGDRACLALGRALQAPVLTTDSAWEGLDLGVEVRQIR